MNRVLLKSLAPFISLLFWVLSIYLFLRGHNEPGGGFIGALCFALGFLLFSFSVDQPKSVFDLATKMSRPLYLIGLFLFLFSLFAPVFLGQEPLEALWTSIKIPVAGKLSSVLIFDSAIYILVVASILSIFSYVFSEKSDA